MMMMMMMISIIIISMSENYKTRELRIITRAWPRNYKLWNGKMVKIIP